MLQKRKKYLSEKRKIQEKIKKIRAKRLVFLRYDWDKFYRIGRQETWRKPKGIDNPMRLELKGSPLKVKVGYGSLNDIKGLHPSGLKPVIVRNKKELEKLSNLKNEVIVILSSTLGLKKRLELLRRAQELGLKVANG
ncbi:50S ribosomal protein L32e [Sulfolobus sp. SCGC AB-777_L09]|nr:50S ribosomal protein L32e [Stygiolobus sp.]MDT7875677.1 50S ribosomal protein L32e [Sulfolobaceae archaeon]PVU70738.1 50S ribosomal protein L32e [Sulfolobus sp. SCGC AB-777_L09]